MADPAFRDDLVAALPSLRAFAISLTRDGDLADDLVQDTLVQAISHSDRYQPGTNLKAWLRVILRNRFYTGLQKKREVEDPDGAYAGALRTLPDQGARLDLQDLWAALGRLPVAEREALILIGAEGLSYDEAAQITGVPVGTLKTRVHRARARLAGLLAVETAEDLGPDQVTQAVLQDGP